jgi:6,7-dimethyl-8-ribityllumazine synthase
MSGRLLIVEARFYDEIADALLAGAKAAARAAGYEAEVVTVPGALEIGGALALAARAGLFDSRYAGAVALGCVIRGETTHYETVAEESARALTLLAVRDAIPVGNGILTVETIEQARVRAAPDDGDKGGDAVRACIALLATRARFTELAHG